jgi:hypothetical protein
MTYVRPYRRKDGTRVKGHNRSARGRRAQSPSLRGGGGSGFGIAISAAAALGGLGYVAVQSVTGSSAASTITPNGLRLATTRVSIAGAALTFSAAEPKVTDRGDAARIDYSVRVENRGGRTVVWDSGQQELKLEDKQSIRGVEKTVQVAAHKSHDVTLSFDVDENEKPVALRLELKGKRVTIKLDADLPSTPLSSPSS